MKRDKIDEMSRKYETLDVADTDDFIKAYSRTRLEMKETINYLIHHRERLRDVELHRLELESNRLLEQVKNLDKGKLVEELRCFKEILALQKKLLENNDKPRD